MITYQSQSKKLLESYAGHDKFGFLSQSETAFDTHRPLLYLALCLTGSGDQRIVELGSGHGSTPLLINWVKEFSNRIFQSFETDEAWSFQMEEYYRLRPKVVNWDTDNEWRMPCSVILIDEAPGEHRVKAIEEMREKADILVVHDTELYSAADYGFHNKKGQGSIWDSFRYCLHYNRKGSSAGATAVSQKINLNQFKFLSFGQHIFE